jgi:hypothetical protein
MGRTKVNRNQFCARVAENEFAECGKRKTNKQMADEFGISEPTFYAYLKKWSEDIDDIVRHYIPKVRLRAIQALLNRLDKNNVSDDTIFKALELGQVRGGADGEESGSTNSNKVYINLAEMTDAEIERDMDAHLQETRKRNLGKRKGKA